MRLPRQPQIAEPDLAEKVTDLSEVQVLCEARVEAMSGQKNDLLLCKKSGNGRHAMEDCWVLHPSKVGHLVKPSMHVAKPSKM